MLEESCESVLKRFLLQSASTTVPRDLLQQMRYTQLCTTVKQSEVRPAAAAERSCRARCGA